VPVALRQLERREKRERGRDASEHNDRSGYSQRSRDVSPSPARRPKGLAWDSSDERERERHGRAGGGRDSHAEREMYRDRDRDYLVQQSQSRPPLARKPEWDRRTRRDGSGVPVDRYWEDRVGDGGWGNGWGGKGGGGGRGGWGAGRPQLAHEPVHPTGGLGRPGPQNQWGPQARASRNVSARLEERRAEMREQDRQRESHVVRAVSSPQVSNGPKSRIHPAPIDLPFIGGGLG
jgi:hypothetical protein